MHRLRLVGSRVFQVAPHPSTSNNKRHELNALIKWNMCIIFCCCCCCLCRCHCYLFIFHALTGHLFILLRTENRESCYGGYLCSQHCRISCTSNGKNIRPFHCVYAACKDLPACLLAWWFYESAWCWFTQKKKEREGERFDRTASFFTLWNGP